jgi:hypothetical protein
MIVDKQEDLDLIMSAEIRARSKKSENEWLFCFRDAKSMINKATEASIAVLGLEIFRVSPDGLETVHYNGYEFKCDDWKDFVEENNRAANEYVDANVYGDGYVYVLSSTSEREFKALTAKS